MKNSNKNLIKRSFSALAACAVCLGSAVAASATDATPTQIDFNDYVSGTYDVDASLSCYITAMGGVEFGASLLTDTTVTVNEDGTAALNLMFSTSSVTIYGLTVDTYVGEGRYLSGAKADAVIGYQNASDEWITEGINYALSGEDNTVTPSYKDVEASVQYITQIDIPVEEIVDTYQLAMVVDSSFMGMQFGYDSNYAATLTVDWSTFAGELKLAETTTTTTTTTTITTTTTAATDTTTSVQSTTSATTSQTAAAETTSAVETTTTATTTTAADSSPATGEQSNNIVFVILLASIAIASVAAVIKLDLLEEK